MFAFFELLKKTQTGVYEAVSSAKGRAVNGDIIDLLIMYSNSRIG